MFSILFTIGFHINIYPNHILLFLRAWIYRYVFQPLQIEHNRPYLPLPFLLTYASFCWYWNLQVLIRNFFMDLIKILCKEFNYISHIEISRNYFLQAVRIYGIYRQLDHSNNKLFISLSPLCIYKPFSRFLFLSKLTALLVLNGLRMSAVGRSILSFAFAVTRNLWKCKLWLKCIVLTHYKNIYYMTVLIKLRNICKNKWWVYVPFLNIIKFQQIH